MSYDRPSEPPRDPEHPGGSEHEHRFPITVDVARDGTVTFRLPDREELKVQVRPVPRHEGHPPAEPRLAEDVMSAGAPPPPGSGHPVEVCISHNGWPPGVTLCVQFDNGWPPGK